MLEVNLQIDIQCLLRLFGHDMVAHIFLETTTELRNVLLLHGQTNGVGVSAKVLQEVATRLDGIVDVKTCYATSRTRGHAIDNGQHDGGTEVEFRQTGSHDAYHAFLPAFVVEYDRLLVLLALKTSHDFVSLFGHLLVHVASLVVIFIYTGSNGQRLLQVAFYQQIYGLKTILHSSGGVYAGAYLEHDVTHGELAPRQSTYLNDGFQTYRATLVELLQTVESQDSVLTLDRYQIGCYRHGTEVE